MFERQMSCCGWSEIYDLNYWDGTVEQFNTYIKAATTRCGRGTTGAAIFTSNTKDIRDAKIGRTNNAERLAHFITKKKLGKIIKLPTFTNPNTSNTIYTYAWLVDHEAVRLYKAKLLPKTVKKAKGGMELY